MTARQSIRQLACAFLAAVVVLSSDAIAHDYDAVAKRLNKSVKKGEISAEQAKAMLAVLKKNSTSKDDTNLYERFEAWATKVGDEIKSAAEAGDITEKEAWQEWKTFKAEEFVPRMKAVVKQGAMSEAAAKKLMGGIEMAEVGDLIKAAVARGEITPEEGREKWNAYVEMKESGKSKYAKEEVLERIGGWVKKMGEEIRTAVAGGKITEDEGWKKWTAFKEEKLGPKLRGVVESEMVTAAEAKEFWRGVELAEFGDRIKAAVARGDMTEEEGKAKWEELLKESKAD